MRAVGRGFGAGEGDTGRAGLGDFGGTGAREASTCRTMSSRTRGGRAGRPACCCGLTTRRGGADGGTGCSVVRALDSTLGGAAGGSAGARSWGWEGLMAARSALMRSRRLLKASGSASSSKRYANPRTRAEALSGNPALAAWASWLMLTPMRLSSASAVGSESEIPGTILGLGGGRAAASSIFAARGSLPDTTFAIVSATKALTDAPAPTAATSMASRCSMGRRTDRTTVFGAFGFFCFVSVKAGLVCV